MENYSGVEVSAGVFSKLIVCPLLSKMDITQSCQQLGLTEGLSPTMAGLLVSEP